jgi:hypothetical protein
MFVLFGWHVCSMKTLCFCVVNWAGAKSI